MKAFSAEFARDVILSKPNATGSALVYSTYLGGGADEIGKGVDLDGAGNAYVAGYTDSVTFPVITAYQFTLREFPPLYHQQDIRIT